MKKLLMSVCALALIVSCSKEEERPQTPPPQGRTPIANPGAPGNLAPNGGNAGVGGGSSGEITAGGRAFIRMGTGDLRVAGNALEGTGNVVVRTPLTGDRTDYGYTLRVSIPQRGQSVTLVSHARRDLSGGLRFKFENDGAMLVVTLTSDAGSLDLSVLKPALRGFRVGQPMDIRVEVHNTHAHFIIENSDETIRADISGRQVANYVGRGNFWGFLLNNGSVTVREFGPSHHH